MNKIINKTHKSVQLGQIIGKYLTNKESDKEKEILDKWINNSPKNKELLDSISSNKNLVREYEVMDSFNGKMGLERFKEKILLKSKTRALFRWRIAASFFVLVSILGLLCFFSGKSINEKSNLGLYTSVFTENGQRSKVILPDSSVVWLNSGTTLSYPNDFSDQNRKVILKGQAFFHVSHKKNYPFIVKSNNLEVIVKGTKFDVETYPEKKQIDVVLKSGRVDLKLQNSKSFSYTMKPGEKAVFDLTNNNSMKVIHVDAAIYSSWKDGKLIFRNSPMREVVEKLKRWYNIDIDIVNPEVYHSIFSGTIKNESYEEIFRLIGLACNINCKIIHHYNEKSKPMIMISKK